MESEGRIIANSFPEDWKYYTLTFPVARYNHLSWADILSENETCYRAFYSYPHIICRVFSNLWRMRKPFKTLVSIVFNLTMRSNMVRHYRDKFRGLDLSPGGAQAKKELLEVRDAV